MEIVEAIRWREREEKFAAIGVGAGVGHREDAGGVVPETGDEFVGKAVRDRLRLVVGVLEAGVATLENEAGNNAIPSEAGVERMVVFRRERALGEPDEIRAHQRSFGEEEFGDDDATRRRELGVEAVGQRGRLSGMQGMRRENEND